MEQHTKVSKPLGNFLDQLKHWEFSFPIETQWVLVFDSFPEDLYKNVLTAYERLNDNATSFNLSSEYRFLLAEERQKLSGCIFAYNVKVPNEGSTIINTSSLNIGGQLISPALSHRNRLVDSRLNIDFIDTTISFTDMVVRPWAILTSYKGLVARKTKEEIFTNIYLYEFGPWDPKESISIRRMWSFNRCAPISVSGFKKSYDSDKEIVIRETEWTFTTYNLHTPIHPTPL